MSIIRTFKNKNFTTLDNTSLQDQKLSWQAKGLMAYLLHLPDNWEIYVSDLKNRSKNGRDGTAAVLKELIEANYIIKTPKKNQTNKGKFDGWDYEVHETGIKNNIETITEKPLLENRNGKTVTANTEQLNTNKINTNIIKDTKVSNRDFKQNPILDNKIDPLFSTIQNNTLFPILKKIIDRGKFPHKLDPMKPPSKLIQKCITALKEIENGTFYKKRTWDNAWIKRFELIPPKSTSHLEKLILKSLDRFLKVKTDKDYFPEDKTALKKLPLDLFFYNPRSKISSFLKYLYCKPEPASEIYAQTQQKNIPENISKILKNLYNNKNSVTKDWGSGENLKYWSCWNKTIKWYKENKDKIQKANNAATFHSYVGTLEKFINLIVDFLENEWSTLFPYPITAGSEFGCWRAFIHYQANTKELILNATDEAIKRAQGSKVHGKDIDRENRINKKIDRLSRICEQDGMRMPSMQELTKMAVQDINQEDKEDAEDNN